MTQPSRFVGRAAVLFFAAVFLAVPLAWAQTGTGVIDGRVFDETKALVPGATVSIRNVATGLTRSTTSSASGTYRVASLPAGTYDVTAELLGFATQIHKGIVIPVSSIVNLDFTMKVTQQSETVTVTGETPLVQTTASDVGQVITQALVEAVPLNGRRFQDLSLLVPGTRQSNYYDPTKTEVGGISYGGGTGRSVIINVDGADNNDGVVRGILQQFSADSIQEYKVTTQRYSAEYGRSVGGVVNVVTKSGTNDFHGSVFGFGRNENLNSKTYFQKEAGIDKQPYKQYQVGGSLGGPIVKDKAHFFAGYEFNNRESYATVFTNGVLPAEEGAQKKPFRAHMANLRLDYAFGSNNAVIRYTLESNRRENDFAGGNTLASAGALNTNVIHSVVAKNTTTIGSNKVNEFLFLFQRFENNITANNPNVPGINTPDFFYGANINTPQQTIQKRFQVREDFSFRKEGWGGDHNFKVGAELLRSHYGGFFTPSYYGWFNFAASRGSDINNYLNAIADTFTGSAGDNHANDNWTYVAGYIQDDWKPTRNLTLNLGLRYEIQWGPYNNNYDTITKRDLRNYGYGQDKKTDMNNVGPRIGFAWDIKGDTKYVARGGYGIYYDEIFQNITLYEVWSTVDMPLYFVSASPPSFTAAQYAANRQAIRDSFIDPTFAGQQVRLTAPDLVQPYMQQMNVGFSLQPWKNFAFDIDYVHTVGKQEIHRWDVDTPENLSTRVSPAGVYNPTFNRVVVEGNRGHSKFDGIYVTAKARSSKLSLISTYAWSIARNICNDFNARPGDIGNIDWESDWGYAPNDVRHRVTTGGVYQLPYGFQVSAGFQWNTGKPFSALAGLAGRRSNIRAIDPATGTAFPRNECVINGEDKCRADDFLSLDVRLSKSFNFGKSRSLEVLFEVFNLTNHTNFDRDSYVGTYTSANFGTPTEILVSSERQAEFGVRFRF